jgi:16S rRNA (cytosine1402-N4)-methyltransferase
MSTPQIEDSQRGFSWKRDEVLDMRMDENSDSLNAKDMVNQFDEESLSTIIYGYGEERYARKIAKAIVEKRKEKEINTTTDLVEIIWEAVPNRYRHGRLHPATRTFQALRIAVNDEIERFRIALPKVFEKLNNGGRIVVISFHSIEDRIAKNFFKDKLRNEEAQLINKKPITPSTEEIKSNPRSRSAKLRIIEKKITCQKKKY